MASMLELASRRLAALRSGQRRVLSWVLPTEVANTEVFQKRGTCLVMLKRGDGDAMPCLDVSFDALQTAGLGLQYDGVYCFQGEGLNWSLINLNGLRGKSDKVSCEW